MTTLILTNHIYYVHVVLGAELLDWSNEVKSITAIKGQSWQKWTSNSNNEGSHLKQPSSQQVQPTRDANTYIVVVVLYGLPCKVEHGPRYDALTDEVADFKVRSKDSLRVFILNDIPDISIPHITKGIYQYSHLSITPVRIYIKYGNVFSLRESWCLKWPQSSSTRHNGNNRWIKQGFCSLLRSGIMRRWWITVQAWMCFKIYIFVRLTNSPFSGTARREYNVIMGWKQTQQAALWDV